MTRKGDTMTEALDHAVKCLAHARGTTAEYSARVYLAVQTFLADYAHRTRKRGGR